MKKRLTFLMMLVALFSVTVFAQKGLKLQPFQMQPNLKVQAVDRKAQPVTNTVNRRAEGELVTPPSTATVETWYTTAGSFYYFTSDGSVDATSSMSSIQVAIDGADIYLQGLAYYFKDGWIKGTISENTATFASGQLIGSDSYGDEFIVGSADGETVSDIVFAYDATEGVLTASTPYILESGAADAVSPYSYWYSPTFGKEEPAGPEVVVAPEGLVAEEYSISARNYKDDADVTGSVFIGFDGNDVYIQGLSTMLPEAWVKGTLEGTTITFAKGQYFGNYAETYDVYLNVLVGADVVFDYDATAGTLTAQNQFFLVDNSQYYFDSYRGAVIKKVIEKAAMPANPEISALTNGNYGYYITFNVPAVDVNGDGLATSKLYYMIYTDTEGEIAPLTFTPATHSKLTEDMTEIPYGFTENYDFYNTQIYLNDLYSADWNKIGIQSIYYGGDGKNETEVQWFDIKPYAITKTTFDFNAMDVATSSNESTAGDITEALEMTQDDVTLTISPKEESATTPNRFWETRSGAQLRMYSGTLTFTVPEGKQITGIVFNYAKWNEGNGANSGEITDDATAKAATWKGEAQTVVVSIAANSQINSIEVSYSDLPDELVILPEGATTEVWTIDGTFMDSQSSDNIVRQTEVAFVGSDIYVKGIPFYFEESWMKGTIDAETGIATFPSGQFVGEDSYGKEYMVGSEDTETLCDIQFAYDAEAKTLTQLTAYIVENGDTPSEIQAYGYWVDMLIYAGEAIIVDPVEAPEGLETEGYAFNAMVRENGESGLGDPEEYSYQMQVGFDGDDIYFKGLSDNTANLWLKATKNEDGKYVIPANQYMGQYTVLWFTFDYYFTAVDEANNMVDIVLNYDAETNTFTTDQTLVLHDGKRNLGEPYQVFTNVVITKVAEFAATPANPSITSFTPTGSYPKANFDIPLKDVEGNDLLADKMFYTVWVEKEGDVVEPFVVVAGEYENVTEDMTEIPYNFEDNWDIYKGGNPFYFNPTTSVETFKKIGVQSIYYGGGECNKSEIVWVENSSYTGISSILTDTKAGKAVIYNLNGQRVENAQKGLYIINGKKVVVK